MIRILTLILFLLPGIGHALDRAPECERPLVEDMELYKVSCSPETYSPESFEWELLDLFILIALLGTASVLSLRHRSKNTFTAMTAVGLLYFGIFRGGCICPVGATTNFFIGLAEPEMIGKVVVLIFLLPLIAAFLFGRVFCTSACPLGAVQHLLSRRKGYQIPRTPLRILQILPFFVLIATVRGALRGGFFLACKLDLYKLLFFSGHGWIEQLGQWIEGTLTEPGILRIGDVFSWSILGIVLLLGVFIHRPFCRFICPYGVLLGLFSSIGLRRRTIDPSSCFICSQCSKTCPTQAIVVDKKNRTAKVSNFHCIQCGRCDEICKAGSFGTPSPYPTTNFPNIAKPCGPISPLKNTKKRGCLRTSRESL